MAVGTRATAAKLTEACTFKRASRIIALVSTYSTSVTERHQTIPVSRLNTWQNCRTKAICGVDQAGFPSHKKTYADRRSTNQLHTCFRPAVETHPRQHGISTGCCSSRIENFACVTGQIRHGAACCWPEPAEIPLESKPVSLPEEDMIYPIHLATAKAPCMQETLMAPAAL
jgi:hypothetical protein